MALQTPVRPAPSPRTVRTGGPSWSLTARHGIAFARNPCAGLLRRTRLRLVSAAVTPTSVTAMRPRGGLPVRVG